MAGFSNPDFGQFRLGDAIQAGQTIANNNFRLGEIQRAQQVRQAQEQAVASPEGMQNFQQQFPLEAKQYQSQESADKLTEQSNKLKLLSSQLGITAQLASGVTDESSYQAALQKAKDAGIPVTNAPPNYDPNWVKAAQDQSLTAKDRVDIQLKNLDLYLKKTDLGLKVSQQAETVRHNRAMESIQDRAMESMQGGGMLDNTGAPIQPETHGEDYLKSLPGNIGAQVKALAEGRMQFPAGFALKSPYWQKMITMVSQYDPTFDAVNYNARSQTRKGFTSGVEGRNVTAINTAIGHLNDLSDAADGLDNSAFTPYNTISNYLINKAGDPRVQRFESAKNAVIDELSRVFKGSQTSEQDINRWRTTLEASNSPEQLHGVIDQMVSLLGSRISALGEQYDKGMGTTEQGLNLLTTKSRMLLDRLHGKTSSSSSQPLPTKNSQGWTLHVDAQGNKAYVGPNGEVQEVQ